MEKKERKRSRKRRDNPGVLKKYRLPVQERKSQGRKKKKKGEG